MVVKKKRLGIAKGFRKRTLVTAKLGMKLGLKATKTALNISKGEMDEAAALELAEELLEEIDGLKGLTMKFGQMASYLGNSFPPNAQRILAKLQSEASALPFQDLKPVLEQALGDEVANIFDTFDEEAFAAGSIGQVHKAIYQGKQVVVKIQYPGVAEAIDSDLKTIGGALLIGLTGAMQNGKGLTDELKQRLTEECDYTLEADHQDYFYTMYQNDPNIIIPQVIRELSTSKVLVSEFIEAQSFYDFKDTAHQEQKNIAAGNIFKFCMSSIFRYGVFNADPHPGNYLIYPDGRVAFLDFGCVKRFEPNMIENWQGSARATLDDDLENFKKYQTRLGIVRNQRTFNWPAHFAMLKHVYRPFKDNTPFTYKHDYVAESYDAFFKQNKNKLSMTMPPDFLFVNRLSFGMDSVLADLNASANWHEIFVESVFAD